MKIKILALTMGVVFTGLISLAAQSVSGGSSTARATFAGGCFWCMEPPFEKMEGVDSVVSGYTGGTTSNPTYEQVSAGGTGHVEAVLITFDSAKVSYSELLEVFWKQIDPTDDGGQFVDRGHSYIPVIYYHDEQQRSEALESRAALEASGRFDAPIKVPVVEVAPFYRAEEYHQDYYKKNPLRYKYYRYGSGRDRFLDKAWGDER